MSVDTAAADHVDTTPETPLTMLIPPEEPPLGLGSSSEPWLSSSSMPGLGELTWLGQRLDCAQSAKFQIPCGQILKFIPHYEYYV